MHLELKASHDSELGKSPLVSLIMAAYNAEQFIGESIRSVLAQTHKEWELILVDDGSLDTTGEIARSFDDPRIRLFQQENQGVSVARNRAIKELRGELIAIVDADDLLPPDSLEVRISRMRETGCDIVSGAVAWFETVPRDLEPVWRPDFRGDLFPELVRLNGKVFFSMSYLMRVSKNMELHFPKEMTHAEDLFFWTVACSTIKAKFDFVPGVVYHYRQHQSSAMKNLKGLERGYWQLFLGLQERGLLRRFRDSVYLRTRIARVMVLSYLAAGSYRAALQVPINTIAPHCFLHRSQIPKHTPNQA
jgi:glycosyltransferase involved in cell wall biosynthesis